MKAENFNIEKLSTNYEQKSGDLKNAEKEIISIFDTDKNGELDKSEIEQAYKQIQSAGFEQVLSKISISKEQLITFFKTKSYEQATISKNDIATLYSIDINAIEQIIEDKNKIEVVLKNEKGKQFSIVLHPKTFQILEEKLNENNNEYSYIHGAEEAGIFILNGKKLNILTGGGFLANSDTEIKDLTELIKTYKRFIAEEKPYSTTPTRELPIAEGVKEIAEELQNINTSSFLSDILKGGKIIAKKQREKEVLINKEKTPEYLLANSELPQEYRMENLEKKYPKDKYEIYISQQGIIEIKDNNTENIILKIDPFGNFVKVFNEKGEQTEVNTYNNGLLVQKIDINTENMTRICTNYSYDDDRQLVSTAKVETDEMGFQTITTITTYENGKPIKTRVEYNPNYLMQELQRDIYAKNEYGLPTTRDSLGKHVKAITPKNVMAVLNNYKDNPDNECLITAIANEAGLSLTERMEYIEHIANQAIENLKQQGINISELESEIRTAIAKEKKSLLYINSENIARLIDRLIKINRGKQTNTKNIDSANGKIDKNFKQGDIGDCWLLAGIKALSLKPKGLEILNNSIKVQEDGSVIVTLKGPNKSYHISKEELLGSGELSTGDMDVRALEIAMERFLYEHPQLNFLRYDDDLDSGNAALALEIFTGKKNSPRIEFIWQDSQIESFNDPNRIITVGGGTKNSQIFKDKNGKEVKLIPAHAYTVKGSDNEYVYLINPHDTSKVLAVPIDIFKDFFNTSSEIKL